MTVLLTDSPLAGALPPGAEIADSVAAAELGAPMDALWRALGGAPVVSRGSCALLGPWRTLAVVREAAVSQLDTLDEWVARAPEVATPFAACALVGRGCHGLRGRAWQALAGNLHLVAAFRLTGALADVPTAQLAPALVMLPAVAVAEAVADATQGRVAPRIKWVNDLCVAGHKLGGVLTRTGQRGRGLSRVTYGIGLNLVAAPDLAPDQRGWLASDVPRATSLRAAMAAEGGYAPPSHGSVLAALLGALGRRHVELAAAGPAPIIAAYRALSFVVGRRVRIFAADETFEGPERPVPVAEGVVESVADDLALRLRGHSTPISQGRLLTC